MYRKILIALVIGVFTNSLFAQNTKDCSKMGIETVNISNPNLTVSNNLLVIPQNGTKGEGNWLIFTRCTRPNVTEIVIDLRGEDIKGNKITVSAIGKLNTATGLFESQVSAKETDNSPLYIREISCTVSNACNEKASFTEQFGITNKKTSFAVLLNGRVGLNNGVCHFGRCFCVDDLSGADNMLILGDLLIEQSIKASKEGFTHAISIGLANGPIEDNDIIESLLMWNKLQMIAVTTVRDVNGKLYFHRERAKFHGSRMAHMIQDSYPRGHNSRIVRIDLEFVNDAMDTFKLNTYGGEGYKSGSGEYFAWSETWKINQHIGDCTPALINKVYLKETITDTMYNVVIGLQDPKNEAKNNLMTLLDKNLVTAWAKITLMDQSNKVYSIVAKAKRNTLTGRYTFDDSRGLDASNNQQYRIINIEISTASICKDSFTFASAFKRKLNDNSGWGYVVTMSNGELDPAVKAFKGIVLSGNATLKLTEKGVGIDNPIFIGSTGSQDNVLNRAANSNNPSVAQNNTIKDVFMSFNLRDCNGKIQTYTSRAILNSKTNMYEIRPSFEVVKTCTNYIIEGASIQLVNEKKDTIVLESNGEIGTTMDGNEIVMLMDKVEKIKYYDPCKTKYRLKELTYRETNIAGMYALNVQFQFENNSDVPEEVAMIVELTDCIGKHQYIRIALKYNALTGLYTGSQALVQNKACPWEMTYGEIAAYNACKDKTVWSFETSESKSNGSGTRNVATANNGKPSLL